MARLKPNGYRFRYTSQIKGICSPYVRWLSYVLFHQSVCLVGRQDTIHVHYNCYLNENFVVALSLLLYSLFGLWPLYFPPKLLLFSSCFSNCA